MTMICKGCGSSRRAERISPVRCSYWEYTWKQFGNHFVGKWKKIWKKNSGKSALLSGRSALLPGGCSKNKRYIHPSGRSALLPGKFSFLEQPSGHSYLCTGLTQLMILLFFPNNIYKNLLRIVCPTSGRRPDERESRREQVSVGKDPPTSLVAE